MSGSFIQSERERSKEELVQKAEKRGEAVGKQNESVLQLAKHLQEWQAFEGCVHVFFLL